MTQTKTKNLKNQMCGEFAEIFNLCHEVLESAHKTSLISATLQTLLRFLNWIPLGYIFETNLISILCNRVWFNINHQFFEVPLFRNIVLKCLTEIASLQVGSEYDPKFVILYGMVMGGIKSTIPLECKLYEIYENSDDDIQNFIQNTSLFFATFFSAHLRVVNIYSRCQRLLLELMLLSEKCF